MDKPHHFELAYRDAETDRSLFTRLSFSEGMSHDEVVSEFLNFLSGVYGYNLRDCYAKVERSVEVLIAQEAFDTFEPNYGGSN